MNFKDYANYYNLLYQDKDYKAECDYVHRLLQQYCPGYQNILDLGCGTGKHVFEFEKLGYTANGVDLSPYMIRMAKEEKAKLLSEANFEVGDIRNYRSKVKYDAVVSLFHVMSYQVSDEDVMKAFEMVRLALKKEGLFVFDYWHGPAVLIDRPVSRIKTFENSLMKVNRVSHPEMDFERHLVNVAFEVSIENKRDGEKTTLQEIHPMRFLFVPEIESLAKRAGFEVLKNYNWMSEDELDISSWYGLSVLKAVG